MKCKLILYFLLLIVIPKSVFASPLTDWINRLETFELDFNHPRNYCHEDVNHKLSCGCLQFQKDTFKDYSKRLSFEGKWLSCPDQKKLTALILLDNPEKWRLWWWSVIKRGLGKPPVDNEVADELK